MKPVTLITGGSRSGKSQYALTCTNNIAGKRFFIATAQGFDDEMKERIRRHQLERADLYQTIEEPLELGKAISALPSHAGVAVVDCLTVWLGNLMHENENLNMEDSRIQDFLKSLEDQTCPLVIVSNEVGMGIIPDNAMARRFRDIAGRMNQIVAVRADHVIFMVSGIAQTIKEKTI